MLTSNKDQNCRNRIKILLGPTLFASFLFTFPFFAVVVGGLVCVCGGGGCLSAFKRWLSFLLPRAYARYPGKKTQLRRSVGRYASLKLL